MASQRLCAACSTSILTSFAAACGARIPRSVVPTRQLRLGTSALSSRTFHHTGVRLEAEKTSEFPETPAAAKDEKEAVPWFLRVETPAPPKHPLADRSKLPDIPEDAPSEVAEVLNQLSVEHGITDLSLIDLRILDPPPALGANSIMLVGTARSVRHLHATADKICRFMRSEYKWAPFADGLLGRNELRLINRRKQRRGKVVSTQLGEVDEAGSSAWVCVNGTNQKVVVQLFTAAKRVEMDIEGLWQPMVERAERHRIAEAGRQAEREKKWAEEEALKNSEATGEAVEVEGARETEKAMTGNSEVDPKNPRCSLQSVSGPMVQSRSLHQLTSAASEAIAPVNIAQHPSFPDFVRTGDLSEYLSSLPPPPPNSTVSPVLQAHIDTLKSPLVTPASLIGTGFDDHSSTPFLRTFYAALPAATPAMQLKYELELLTLSNTHAPTVYPIAAFLPYLQRLRAEGAPLQPAHYYLIMSHISTCSELRPSTGPGWQNIVDARLALLDTYFTEVKRAFPEETDVESRPEFRYAVFTALLKVPITDLRNTIIAHPDVRFRTLDLPIKPAEMTFHPKMWRGKGYGSLMDSKAHQYTLKEHHLDLLTALGLGNKWDRVWTTWKRLPLHGVHRGREYYKLVLGLVTMAGKQKEAIYAARMLGVEAMSREVPKVWVEKDKELARAYLNVLEVAEGDTKTQEWVDARKVCERALEA